MVPLRCFGLLLLAACTSPDAERTLRDALRTTAEESLPDSGDGAAVMRLEDGVLLLVHHRPVLAERRVSPGSVLKVPTTYALLARGLEDAEHVCNGAHRDRFGSDRPCWLRAGHGRMRLRTALAASCNVWFYEQSGKLEWPELRAVMEQFGIGAAWDPKDKVAADEVPLEVDPRDLLDAAIGDHGALAVTPLSLLRMVSVVATRGRHVVPHESGPARIEDPRLDPARLDLIALGMEEAVDGGTLEGVLAGVAAKTGTARRDAGRGTRGFVIGYLPRSAPRFAFVVAKDHGRGAVDAGPAAARLVALLAEVAR